MDAGVSCPIFYDMHLFEGKITEEQKGQYTNCGEIAKSETLIWNVLPAILPSLPPWPSFLPPLKTEPKKFMTQTNLLLQVFS